MSRADELRAALRVAELEEELVAAKADGGEADRELKLKVREAREEERKLREAAPDDNGGSADEEPAEGDAVARPGTATRTARSRRSRAQTSDN